VVGVRRDGARYGSPRRRRARRRGTPPAGRSSTTTAGREKGAERDPAAELKVTAAGAPSSSRWPRSPLDSHRPRESTTREMRDAVAHNCWRPSLLRVSSICRLCAKGTICRCGWACLLETVLARWAPPALLYM
jgi:hypothetical protein